MPPRDIKEPGKKNIFFIVRTNKIQKKTAVYAKLAPDPKSKLKENEKNKLISKFRNKIEFTFPTEQTLEIKETIIKIIKKQ